MVTSYDGDLLPRRRRRGGQERKGRIYGGGDGGGRCSGGRPAGWGHSADFWVFLKKQNLIPECFHASR
jgi:hypothetical protein